VPWLVRWVQDLIVVVFFASAAYLLLPENELRPYARLVMGLVVIAALLAPAVELLQWEPALWAPRLAPAGEEAAALIADGRRMAAEAQRRVLDEGRARAEAHVAGVAELALGGPPAAVEVMWGPEGIERVRVDAPHAGRDEAERAARVIAGLLGLRPEQVAVAWGATEGQGGAGR